MTLGVDVGGTKIAVGLVDGKGFVNKEYSYPTTVMEIREWADQLTNSIYSHYDIETIRKIDAIGIGFRGVVDSDRNELLGSTLVRLNNSFSLTENISKEFGIPCFIENDVKAATIAELTYGIGRKHRNFGCINVGTGLGLGIVIDGKVVHGSKNKAGEICDLPYWTIDKNIVGIEHFASGKGIEDLYHKRTGKGELKAKDILVKEKDGDLQAIAVINEFYRAIAVAIADTEAVINLEHYVFVGGVAKSEAFINKVSQWLGIIGDGKLLQSCTVELSSINSIGIVGAASVVAYYMNR